ncbi:MAG TPA: hypothetical protein VFM68_00300, partial [Candidatus Saccharimonadales bacterium]|nr:hypothetical protein [Candidatus Saccharimonadales bacterium]
MYHGGVKINDRTAQIIRFASLIIPVVLTFYGLFIQYGVADRSHYINDIVFFSIMIPWVVLASFYFLYSSTNKLVYALSLVICHLLAALYILFVSGFATPFIAGWILLFIATYAYFYRDGLRLSILVLVAAAAADAVLHLGAETILFTNIITVISLLIVGITALSISQIQEVDTAELSRSKAQETLERDRILTIVNNLADAVLSTDENGIIRVYNAASLNLLDTNTGLDGRPID